MASRRISSLLTRSATFYVNLSSSGRSSCMRSGLSRFSTSAVIDKSIARPLEDNYTRLLINQPFAYAASGMLHVLTVPTDWPYQVKAILHETIRAAGPIIRWSWINFVIFGTIVLSIMTILTTMY